MRQLRVLLFCLLAAAPAFAIDFAALTGNYRLTDGTLLGIAEWELSPGDPHVLAFTDFKTGRFGVLAEAGQENKFALNAGILSGSPVATLTFDPKSGTVDYAPANGAHQRGRRALMRTTDVSIHAEGADLQGTLYVPNGKGPFPAIVLVPAGRLHRTATATFPNFFLSQGFAVLIYDRRAQKAPLETYADDAIAAVHDLQHRSEIDARHVGLWGHSQGGWLSLIAAAKSDAVAFVIDHSGMLVPAWQQELYRVGAESLADGVDAAQASLAVAYESEMMNVARTGQGWDALEAKRKAAGNAAWLGLVYQPASLDELQSVWKNDFSFDPRPFAARIKQPVLALFGGLDRSTPIESAASLVNARGDRKGLTVRFFPTADHAFLEGVTGGNREIPALKGFVPGMFEEMRSWLRERH